MFGFANGAYPPLEQTLADFVQLPAFCLAPFDLSEFKNGNLKGSDRIQ
jgi:hypothetical protein